MPDEAAQRHVAAHPRTLGREMGAMSRIVSRSLGLHPTQLPAIEAVLQQPRMTACELSGVLGLSTGATTSLLDHLVPLGHLRRGRMPRTGGESSSRSPSRRGANARTRWALFAFGWRR